MNIDSVLNFLIPVGVIFFFGAAMYKALKEPIDKMISGIKSLFVKKKNQQAYDNPYLPDDRFAYYPKY